MRRGFCVLAASLAIAAMGAKDAAPRGYPDQSEPKAAAYALSLALMNGDQQAVSQIYVGTDGAERAKLEQICRLQASMKRFHEAAEKRFGAAGAALGLAEQPRFGGYPLSALVASASLSVDGDKAQLAWSISSEKIQLEKRKNAWYVTRLPIPEPANGAMTPVLEGMTDVFRSLADDLNAGQFNKPYEVEWALAGEMRQKMELVHRLVREE